MATEQRVLAADRSNLRLASRSDDKTPKIEGYGAVYYDPDDPGTEYKLWRDTYERIAAGAFDRAIQEDDVRSLFNHDANIVLGRNRSDPATLALRSDQTGLFYSVDPPDTQMARDQVITPIGRGDVSGSSFIFEVKRVVWIEEERDDREVYIRQIEEVNLWEVGPVVFPAYQSTTTGVRVRGRDLAEIRAEHDRWKRSGLDGKDFAEREAEAVRVTARLAEVRSGQLGM